MKINRSLVLVSILAILSVSWAVTTYLAQEDPHTTGTKLIAVRPVGEIVEDDSIIPPPEWPPSATPPDEAVLKRFRELHRKGRYVEAESKARQLMNSVGSAPLPQTPKSEELGLELGRFFREAGDFRSAKNVLMRLTAARTTPQTQVAAYCGLAKIGVVQHAYAEAIGHAQQAVVIGQKQLAANDPGVLEAQVLMALAYAFKIDAKEAREVGEPAFAQAEKALPADSLELARIRCVWGQTKYWLSEYRESEKLVRLALARLKREYPAGHCAVVEAQMLLASPIGRLGRLEEAKHIILETLESCKGRLSADHLYVGWLHNNLGGIEVALGRPDEAKRLFQQALEIKRKSQAGALDVATGCSNLAGTLSDLGEVDEALALYTEALNAVEAEFGKDDPRAANTLGNFSVFLSRQGRHQEALDYAERGAKLAEKGLGADHSETIWLRDLTIQCRLTLGDTNVPTDVDVEALKLAVGERSPRIAMVINTARRAAMLRSEWPNAERLARMELEARAATFGDSHSSTATSHLSLALALVPQGKIADAVAELDLNRRIMQVYLSAVLPSFDHAQQASFIKKNDHYSFWCATGLAAYADEHPGLAEKTAEWALNGKATLVDVLAREQVVRRQGKDNESRRLVGEIEEASRALSAALERRPGAESAEENAQHVRKIAELRESVARQQTLLDARVGRAESAARWVTIDEVREAIPQDAVLIEFLQTPKVVKGKAIPDTIGLTNFGAWIIPAAGAGEVRFVEIGEADVIESAVARLNRVTVDGPRRIAADDEKIAVERLGGALRGVSRYLVDPLKPHAGEVKRWIISPDGALWAVPWAALLDGEQWVGERHIVQYATTGRDLLAPDVAVETSPSLVISNPDYNLGADENERAREITPLEGAAREAEAIVPLLAAWDRREPQHLSGAAAQEAAVRKAVSPRVLTLATHGFVVDFAPDSVHPLARCGVTLAGANNWQGDGADDGLLTGPEALEADLRGTQLVLLSACNTAVGERATAEGVADLRRAFHLAGAKSVAGTLWPISDRETVELSTAFIEEFTKSEDAAAALHAAQVRIIKARKEAHGAAHPYFWAGFTVTTKGR